LAVTIRLARYGKNKQAFYRIVVTDRSSKRDGRFIEMIGHINPLTNPAKVTLDEERVKYWLGVGAQPSERMAVVIKEKIPGYLENIMKKRLATTQAKRTKRKARAAA
jgi:small subunit ribosomal protein S16